MASAVASTGVPLATFLKKLFAVPYGALGTGSCASHRMAVVAASCARHPMTVAATAPYARHPMTVAAARRVSYSGGSALGHHDDDEDESGDSEDDVAVDDRRGARNISPVFFTSADLVDPFGKPTTLGSLLTKLDGAMEASQVVKAGLGSLAAPRLGWWVAKQDDDALTLKVPMPGLEKEHVKVRADKNVLVINGEGHKETEGDKDEEELRYSHRIELPADGFKMDQVRAEMKKGMLKVTVPKLKEEERKDVFVVNVE